MISVFKNCKIRDDISGKVPDSKIRGYGTWILLACLGSVL